MRNDGEKNAEFDVTNAVIYDLKLNIKLLKFKLINLIFVTLRSNYQNRPFARSRLSAWSTSLLLLPWPKYQQS